jgi:hypothetical protein
MGYQKLNIALSGLCLAIFLPMAIFCLFMNTLGGYFLGAVFFGFSCYVCYYFYRILWLRIYLNVSKNKESDFKSNTCLRIGLGIKFNRKN